MYARKHVLKNQIQEDEKEIPGYRTNQEKECIITTAAIQAEGSEIGIS